MDIKITHQDLCHIKALTTSSVGKIGGQEAAGLFCGTSTAMMSNYSNVEHAYTLPLHVLIPLLEVSGDHALLHFLAGKFGYALVPEARRDISVKDMLAIIAAFHKEGSEAVSTGLQAAVDGKLDRHELAQMEKEVMEAVSAAQDMLTMIRQMKNAQNNQGSGQAPEGSGMEDPSSTPVSIVK